jgi:hypothetical protein
MNMSARPRTPVSYLVPRLRDEWVSFSWQTEPPQLDEETLSELQQQWDTMAFTGAAIMHHLDADLRSWVRPSECTDRSLTLNVLLRVRGGLLLGEMPPLDDGDAVIGATVATDDPRLVQHAAAGGR